MSSTYAQEGLLWTKKVKGQMYFIEKLSSIIEKIWADTSLATKELGWKTESSLDETMKTAWD